MPRTERCVCAGEIGTELAAGRSLACKRSRPCDCVQPSEGRQSRAWPLGRDVGCPSAGCAPVDVVADDHLPRGEFRRPRGACGALAGAHVSGDSSACRSPPERMQLRVRLRLCDITRILKIRILAQHAPILVPAIASENSISTQAVNAHHPPRAKRSLFETLLHVARRLLQLKVGGWRRPWQLCKAAPLRSSHTARANPLQLRHSWWQHSS